MDRVLRVASLFARRLCLTFGWRRRTAGLPNRSEAQHVMAWRHSIYGDTLYIMCSSGPAPVPPAPSF
jgi:hypothetical protein